MVKLLHRLEERDRNLGTQISSSLESVRGQIERLNLQGNPPNEDPVAGVVKRLQNHVEHACKTNYLLSTFRFDAIHAREDEVKERHAQTFQWAFADH